MIGIDLDSDRLCCIKCNKYVGNLNEDVKVCPNCDYPILKSMIENVKRKQGEGLSEMQRITYEIMEEYDKEYEHE